jgi:hypothetical protein
MEITLDTGVTQALLAYIAAKDHAVTLTVVGADELHPGCKAHWLHRCSCGFQIRMADEPDEETTTLMAGPAAVAHRTYNWQLALIECIPPAPGVPA